MGIMGQSRVRTRKTDRELVKDFSGGEKEVVSTSGG